MIIVTSDGTPAGTHVFGDNGREIHGITRIEWSIDAKEPRSELRLTLVRGGPVDEGATSPGTVHPMLRETNVTIPATQCKVMLANPAEG